MVAGIAQSGDEQVPSDYFVMAELPVQAHWDIGLVCRFVRCESDVSEPYNRCAFAGVVGAGKGTSEGSINKETYDSA